MKALDVAYCVAEQHSLHLVRDNAGSLIALSAPLCRSGWMQYRGDELGIGGSEIINVYRSKDEVLSPAHLASIEGKAVVLGHPSEFLTPANSGYYAKGHVQNVRRGPDIDGEVQVVGDVHVTDQQAIDRVTQGVRDLSLGYHYELDDGPQPGTYTQRNLRCNHCAIVPEGRAKTARIIDAKPPDDARTIGAKFEALVRRFHRKNAFDAGLHIESENKESPMLQQQDDEIKTSEGPMDHKQLLDALTAIQRSMADGFAALTNKGKAKDGECNCGAEEDERHLRKCPLHKKEAADMDENFGERNQNRRGAPDLIPVSGGGAEGNYNPTANDYQTALNNLRGIRSAIAETGDRRAIDAFNSAVKDIKAKLADALMRGPERVGPDPPRQMMDAQREAEGADFEEQCRNFHRAEIPKSQEEVSEMAKRRPAKVAVRRFGVDARSERENQIQLAESYEDGIKAARTKALGKK